MVRTKKIGKNKPRKRTTTNRFPIIEKTLRKQTKADIIELILMLAKEHASLANLASHVRSPIKIGSHFDWPCFSPDGGFLVVAGVRDGVIRVFDTRNWQLVEELQSPGVKTVAISKGATPVMAAGGSNQITLWSQTESGWGVVGELPVDGVVKNLAFTPDGAHLFATVDEDRIEIYDVQLRKLIQNRNLDSTVHALATSPNGDLFAVGQKDGSVQLWELDAILADTMARPVKRLSATDSVLVLAFSPTGKRLAAGTGHNNTVVVWDIVPDDRGVSKHDQPIATILGHSQIVMGVGFVKDKDENAIWSSSVDGWLKSWDLAECQPFDTIPGVHASSPIGFDPNNVLVYLDTAGTLQRWNVTNREYLEPIDEGVRYGHANLSDDGSVLAGVTQDHELHVWLTERRELLYTVSLKLRTVLGLAVNRDGKRVVCVVRDGGVDRVVVIDMERGEVMGPLDFEGFFLTEFVKGHLNATPVFSPDGRYCAIQLGLDTNRTILFDTTEKPFELIYDPIRGWGPELSAAFTPDRKTLAIGSTNNTIRLHDAENGRLKQTLKGHSDLAKSLVFVPNGTRLIAGVADRVHIWRISDGSLLSTFRCSADVVSVAVAPNGESLAALTVNGTINVWRSASKKETDD